MDNEKLDKPAYQDIFNLNLKYIEYLLAKISLGTKREDGALNHLRNIFEAIGMRKDDPRTYFPGGGEILSNGVDAGRFYSGVYFSNPIIGVISVNHVEYLPDKLEKWKREGLADLGLIDLLFSINGYLLCTGTDETTDKDNRSIASIHTQQAPGPWMRTYQPGNDNRPGLRVRTYREKMEEPGPFITYTHPLRKRFEIVSNGLVFCPS